MRYQGAMIYEAGGMLKGRRGELLWEDMRGFLKRFE